MKNIRASIYWFTGLSGSGKTTIAEALKYELIRKGKKVLILDGDSIRLSISKKLGFTEEDIKKNNFKVAELVIKNQNDYDFILIPIISPYRTYRDQIKKLFNNNFYELYVYCSVEKCIERDTKGLYKKALSGKIPNMIGIALTNPYEPPTNPDITIDTVNLTLEESVNMVLDFMKNKSK